MGSTPFVRQGFLFLILICITLAMRVANLTGQVESLRGQLDQCDEVVHDMAETIRK